MWIPPESRDPVVMHAPTRKSVACFGAVNLSTGRLVTWFCPVFNGETFDTLASVGYDGGDRVLWRRYPAVPGTPGGDVVHTLTPVFLESGDDWGARYPEIAADARRNGMVAAVGLPLVVDGERCLGAIGFSWDAPRRFSAEERELFSGLLEHLVDIGRKLQPGNADMFTWWAPWRNMRQRNIGWRIDYILASRSIADRATDFAVLADVGTSDHAPVVATFTDGSPG